VSITSKLYWIHEIVGHRPDPPIGLGYLLPSLQTVLFGMFRKCQWCYETPFSRNVIVVDVDVGWLLERKVEVRVDPPLFYVLNSV
jgi:hypothetical protein